MNYTITTTQQQEVTITTTSTAFNEDCYNDFFNYCTIDQRLTTKTVTTYKKALKQFMTHLATNGIGNPTKEDINNFINSLLAEGKKPSTINSYLTAVKVFFKWADEKGLYKNIASNVKNVKNDNTNFKKANFTKEQMHRILKQADINAEDGTEEHARNRAIIYLLFGAGLRTIELNRANISDLDINGTQRILHVQGKGKQDKSDFVIINPIVDNVISEYLAIRNCEDNNAPLFVSTSNNSKNKALSTTSISVLVKDLFKQCGYNSDKWTAHSTRHTAITLGLDAGATVQQAKDFARHANIQTTLIYAHNLDKLNNPINDTMCDLMAQ